MNHDLAILLGTAAALGVGHTLIGPDHYVPFVMMSRARGWSITKTLLITILSGLGHVASSVVIGLVGIAAGVALRRLQILESTRGEIAGWLLIAFGLVYGSWGLRRALRGRPHRHAHVHADGTGHAHDHDHRDAHAHAHGDEARNITPWVLFTIFVFGPCEPLIPLLMYPAAAVSAGSVALVAAVFALATIATMTTVVTLASKGVKLIAMGTLERYTHALAGAAILLCGVAIRFGL
jgi:nickel/cobalt transporter (NicO) family protein